MRTVHKRDPFAPREVVTQMNAQWLTLGALHEAHVLSRENGDYDSLVMDWPTYEDLRALHGLFRDPPDSDGEPAFWYRARRVVIVEGHPEGVIDLVTWHKPERGVVRLQYGGDHG